VDDEVFVLKVGDSLMAPRNIPHEIRNSGNGENHFVVVFSPSGFEDFVMATAIPAPANAPAPTQGQLQAADEDPAITFQNVQRLATPYGVVFC